MSQESMKEWIFAAIKAEDKEQLNSIGD